MFKPTSERSIERRTEDGYITQASNQFGDRVKLTIKHSDGTSAFDVLNAEDRAGLAAFLLAGLTRDQILDALPRGLLTDEIEEEYDRLPEHDQLAQVIDTYMHATPERRQSVSLPTFLGVLAEPSQGWLPPSARAASEASQDGDN